ncbi:hypothetical protein [Paracidovorax cattleyae]|uniref:hypothetical protein n=1 Tax=Paracidovorax cattleyae TaxID=80868 RepID=UPI00115FCBB9|nr:hypothetical protein [Paracidovorax cattleyae]
MSLSTYLNEANLVFRQGQQLYHLHQMLKDFPEDRVISKLGQTYVELGCASTLAAGIVTAAAVVESYRSTERGERAMQLARQGLKSTAKAEQKYGLKEA